MQLAAQLAKQFGRLPVWDPVYGGAFYPSAGLGIAGKDLLSTAIGKTDADDPRATAVQFQLEETNILTAGQIPYDFFAVGMHTELHLLPKLRQVSGISTDANAIFNTLWGCQNEILNIMNRGVLTLSFNQVIAQQVAKPFITLPPGNGVQINQWAASASSGQVDTFWVTQSNGKKRYVFPDPFRVDKGTTLQCLLEMPDGAGPALTNTVGGNLTPYLFMRFYLDGYRLR